MDNITYVDNLFTNGFVNDSDFKTSTYSDFNFKYIPTDQFEIVLKKVHRDLIKQENTSLQENVPNQIQLPKMMFPDSDHRIVKTKSSTIKYFNDQMADNDYLCSKNGTAINSFPNSSVKVMTDTEIQKFIENAVKNHFNSQGDEIENKTPSKTANNSVRYSIREVDSPKEEDEQIYHDKISSQNENVLESPNLKEQRQKIDSAKFELALNHLDYFKEENIRKRIKSIDQSNAISCAPITNRLEDIPRPTFTNSIPAEDLEINESDTEFNLNLGSPLESVESFSRTELSFENDTTNDQVCLTKREIDCITKEKSKIKMPEEISSKIKIENEHISSPISRVSQISGKFNKSLFGVSPNPAKKIETYFSSLNKKSSRTYRKENVSPAKIFTEKVKNKDSQNNCESKKPDCPENDKSATRDYLATSVKKNKNKKVISNHFEKETFIKEYFKKETVRKTFVQNKVDGNKKNVQNTSTDYKNIKMKTPEGNTNVLYRNYDFKTLTDDDVKVLENEIFNKEQKIYRHKANRSDSKKNLLKRNDNIILQRPQNQNETKDTRFSMYSKKPNKKILGNVSSKSKSLLSNGRITERSDRSRIENICRKKSNELGMQNVNSHNKFRKTEDLKQSKSKQVNIDDKKTIETPKEVKEKSKKKKSKKQKSFNSQNQDNGETSNNISAPNNSRPVTCDQKHKVEIPKDPSVHQIINTLHIIMKKELKETLDPVLHQLSLLLSGSSTQNVEELLNQLNSKICDIDLNNANISSLINKSKGKLKHENNQNPISRTQLDDLKITKENSQIQQNRKAFINSLPTTISERSNNNNKSNHCNSNIPEYVQQQKEEKQVVEKQQQQKQPDNTTVQQPAVDEIIFERELNDVIPRNNNIKENELLSSFNNDSNVKSSIHKNNHTAKEYQRTIKVNNHSNVKQVLHNPEGVECDSHQIHIATAENMDSHKSLKQKPEIKQLLYEKNIQYTFITSKDDETITQNQMLKDFEMNSDLNLNLKSTYDTSINMEKSDPIREVHNEITTRMQTILQEELPENHTESCIKIENLENLFENRIEFIKHIADNPWYVNENFSEPWKVITNISERLLNEILVAADEEIDFGEKSFIEDFLQNEVEY